MTRFLLAAVMVLTACGGGGGPRSITYYFTADPRSLDPAFSTDVPSGEVIATLFDNLTQFDADGRLYVREQDNLYCYDIRQAKSASSGRN